MKNSDWGFLIISKDFNYVVTKGFENTQKNNPFYGIDVTKFNYKVTPNLLFFTDENRAENAIKHFHFKELSEKYDCQFRTYCIRKN